MIVKEEFLKKLRSAFDLNIYEVKIWTALLSKGTATAGELSDISQVPRSRSYDILESLEKKGFVVMKLGKPIKYLAVSPQDIINRVKKNIQSKTDEQVKALDNVKTTTLFKDIELLHKQGIEHVDASNLSGAIKGRDNVYSQIDSILSDAKKQVTIVTSPEGLKRKVKSLRKTLEKLNKNGVKIRIATKATDEVRKLAKEIKNIAEIRNLDNISARYIVVDNKDLMFMISSDKDTHESYDTGIWVNTPFFANALEGMFNLNWNKLEVVK